VSLRVSCAASCDHHQTREDQTVTIHRDTMKQDRVKITDLNAIIENEVSMKNWLMKM
jgi:glycyl-tRNA synthetase